MHRPSRLIDGPACSTVQGGGLLLRAPSHQMHEVRQKQLTKEAMEFEQAEEALQKQDTNGEGEAKGHRNLGWGGVGQRAWP